MATFTITTPVNIDTLSGKTGDDTYTINGGFLTVDQHSRYGLNNNTSATMGTVSPSATLGGSIKVEGRYSRLIPFDGASGTVPADGTTIAGASGSGKLVGIYSTTLNAAPVAAGGAMPASGYALVKQWNGNAYVDNEALSGITANVCIDHILGAGTDRVGWVEIVGRGNTATNWTMNRLNNPNDPVAEGLPYQIGVTDGNRATTYQIPSNGVNQYHGGVLVETGTGTGIYEPYPVTVDNMTSALVPTTEEKGKWCNIAVATGLLRFGHDGTNSSGGWCPPAGRKIVIGNVFMTQADTAAKTQNFYQVTVTSRSRFVTTGAGRVDGRWVSWNWGLSGLSGAQLINLQNCSIVDQTVITNPATAPTLDNVAIGSPVGYAGSGISLQGVTVGITMNKVAHGKSGHGATTAYNLTATDTNDLVATNCVLTHTGARGATTQQSINTSRCDSFSFTDCITSFGWTLSSTTNFEYIDGQYYNSVVPNDIIQASYLLSSTTLSVTALVDGLRIDDGDLPRNGLLNSGSSSGEIVLRNIGDVTAVIGTGLPNGDDITASRVTTTLTVPSTGHGLRTGDTIKITRSEVVASAIRGDFVVTVLDANTFTIPVLNAGATSFKISYVPTQMARLLLIANSTIVKLQNVHARSVRTAIYGVTNDSQQVYLENVTTNYTDDVATVTGVNNLHMYGATQNPLNQTAALAVYGTHIRSGFTAPVGTLPNGSGLSWTRSSTTVTVTHADHGLYTGQRIQTMFTDNQTGAYAPQIAVVTALTKDTFTFVSSANSGTTSGSNLNYKVADGCLFIDCNEDNSASADQFNIIAGTPLFTGAGSLLMGTVNDEVEWVTERYITDFDHAENMLPMMAGGTISNYHLTYDIDTGAGYSGSWKNAYYERATGGGTIATTTVTVASTTGIAVGDYVYGIGIATGAKVASITNATTFEVDIANAAAVSGTLRFSHLPNITGLDADGFQMKIRCKTLTTNTDGITFLRFFFRSTLTTRQVLYPQDVDTVSLVISGLPVGTTVALYDSTDTELQRNDNILTGVFSYEYVHSGVDIEDVYYVIWHEDYIPFKSVPFDLTATDIGLSYTPVDDTVYDSAYDDRYTIDYATKRIVMGAGEDTYDVRGAYSKWKMDIFDADNFIYDFAFTVIGNVTYSSPKRIPPFTGLLNSWKIRPDEDDHTLTVENGILYVDGGGDPFVDTLGAFTVRIPYAAPVEVLTVATGSAVTPDDITDIAEAVEDLWDADIEAIKSNTDATQAKVDLL